MTYGNGIVSRQTKNVGHLVLEVLGRDQGVEQLPATLNHRVNLTTAAAEVRVVVERFPQIVDRLAPRLSTRVDEDANLRLRVRSECVRC